MNREQIAYIAAKFYPLPIKSMDEIKRMDDWCDNLADEIMGLPLDVPSDAEVKYMVSFHAGVPCDDPDIYGSHYREIYDECIRFGEWMRDEIIKRNVK